MNLVIDCNSDDYIAQELERDSLDLMNNIPNILCALIRDGITNKNTPVFCNDISDTR